MKSKIFALILIVSLAAASCGPQHSENLLRRHSRLGGHSRNH